MREGVSYSRLRISYKPGSLRITQYGLAFSRITHHASRITHHASRITHHASRLTHHASRITSIPPIHGLSTSGTTTLPSACWLFSSTAMRVRGRPRPEPLRVC